ncbi:hypothetical protein THRCLA_05778 [Thraustotheca clavata]|uniref:RING-type domain-containing protein n=1 Tax=Thraustotheca clavata TaxID=74557 RepID=A0A1V9ZSQ6_9STRA|nr:hypothetical protein THRCLA_05778 [Thraustotheca clavata]
MGNSSVKARHAKELERYTRPTGLYKSCLWENKIVRKLILERKLAPRYPGSESPRDDSYECPICFLHYPSTLNQTTCCKQALCTECVLQTKPPGKSVCCPFCNREEFKTNFAIGSSGRIKQRLYQADSDATDLSSPEASMSSSIEVQFASVADRKRLQEEVAAQARTSNLGQHHSIMNQIPYTETNATISRMEEILILEAIRRSMLDHEHAHFVTEKIMAAIPSYRAPNPRFGRVVQPKAYTVNEESRFIIVRNIPALGTCDELIERLGLYGNIEEHRMLDDHDDANEFLDVMWIRYATVDDARHAKNKVVQSPFYGNILQISYAPEEELHGDTLNKLLERRNLILNRLEKAMEPKKKEDFIGPLMPNERVNKETREIKRRRI